MPWSTSRHLLLVDRQRAHPRRGDRRPSAGPAAGRHRHPVAPAGPGPRRRTVRRVAMSNFTDAELDFLHSGGRRLARIATIGPDGTPHATPVGYGYEPEIDGIEVGG